MVALAALALSAPARAQSLPSVDDVAAQAPSKPKWEAGLAGIAVTTPLYPGSDDTRTLALPVPYFVYRGRVLQADQEGSRLRHRFTPHVELGFSGGGALSSNSSDSQVREGMPDLDYLIELGPNLKLSFDAPRPRSQLVIDLPVRAVFSLGSGIQDRGFLFAPEASYVDDGLAGGRLSWRVSVGSDFATEKLHDYFYEVAPRYVTEQRPAYAASAGYLGSSLGTRFTYEFTERMRGFVALRYFLYAGSANEDSPLFERDDAYSTVLGVTWSFYWSREKAEP